MKAVCYACTPPAAARSRPLEPPREAARRAQAPTQSHARAMMVGVLRFTRLWLPVIVVVGGVAVMVAGRNEDALLGGAGIVGAGLSIWLLNVLYRVGASGDRARDEEEEARAYFDRHGRWPDEPGPPRKDHKTRPPHEHPRRPHARRPR